MAQQDIFWMGFNTLVDSLQHLCIHIVLRVQVTLK